MEKLLIIGGTILNVVIAKDVATFFIYQLILVAVVLMISAIGDSFVKQNEDGSFNPPKIIKKRMIDEHIKLVLQNSYAAAFLLEQTKITGSIRDQADDQIQLKEIINYMDTLISRDFTADEMGILLDINKAYRRRFDAVKENKNLGSFDEVFNPKYLSQTSWDNEINEFKKEMEWDFSS